MNKKRVNQMFRVMLAFFSLSLLSTAGYYAVTANAGENATKNETASVSIKGPISAEQRLAVLKLIADSSLDVSDITSLRGKLQGVAWIRSVSVEKKWPSASVITVVPEKAVALWNDDAFLNDTGSVFHSPFMNVARLPQLYGPDGKEASVMQQYQLLSSALFKINQKIEFLRLGQRGEWKFRTDKKIDVLLGNEDLMERVQRLVQVTEHIDAIGKLDEVSQIDTRYSNGAAVDWKKDKEDLNVATNYNSQREAKL